MADDEPLDDARAVAMAAGAATARVVETLARESQQAAAQHRATLERAQDQHRAQHVLASPFMPPNLIDAGVLNQLADLFAPIPAFDLLLTSCAWSTSECCG